MRKYKCECAACGHEIKIPLSWFTGPKNSWTKTCTFFCSYCGKENTKQIDKKTKKLQYKLLTFDFGAEPNERYVILVNKEKFTTSIKIASVWDPKDIEDLPSDAAKEILKDFDIKFKIGANYTITAFNKIIMNCSLCMRTSYSYYYKPILENLTLIEAMSAYNSLTAAGYEVSIDEFIDRITEINNGIKDLKEALEENVINRLPDDLKLIVKLEDAGI